MPRGRIVPRPGSPKVMAGFPIPIVARVRAGGLGALAGVALLMGAGCGSSSSTKASTAAAGSATRATIGTTTGQDGTYLIAGDGRALYLWLGDRGGKSSCSGECALSWPPLTTSGAPIASAGVTAAGLGTITRSDGSRQVTYKGHPLYYFAIDSAPGTITGQGSNSFGARWWLVAPSGAAVTANASSGAY